MSDVGPGVLDKLQGTLPADPAWLMREARTLMWWPCELRQVIGLGEPRTDLDMSLCKLTIITRLIEDVSMSAKMVRALAVVNRMACASALIHDDADRSL